MSMYSIGDKGLCILEHAGFVTNSKKTYMLDEDNMNILLV